MQARSFYLIASLLTLQTAAYAQVYKCKNDAGNYVYQGSPCDGNSTTAKDNKQSPSASKNDPAEGRQRKYDAVAGSGDANASSDPSTAGNARSRPTRVAGAESTAARLRQERAVAEMEAINKQQRCQHEMQQLDVVKNGRIIYTNDKQGDRHYVNDADRQAKIATAQNRVSQACN